MTAEGPPSLGVAVTVTNATAWATEALYVPSSGSKVGLSAAPALSVSPDSVASEDCCAADDVAKRSSAAPMASCLKVEFHRISPS